MKPETHSLSQGRSHEMNYKLMHKDIHVADILIDETVCAIVKTGTVHHFEHLPVGCLDGKGHIDRAALNEWWRGRAIPASRQGIQEALCQMHMDMPQNLLEKCMGLSLSDQYWICPVDLQVKWSEVNFFENDFPEDVGNILFRKKLSKREINLFSPDNTSDGWLKKKWSISDGKRYLIKGGSGINRQEPYNEVFASILMERLGIAHVSYSLMMQEEEPYSVCEDFVGTGTELISAWYIMQTAKKENHVSVYQHYLNCCENLGIKGVKEAIDRMLVVDYLIANEDRHQNNFGVLREAETLKWLGAAPIYDSGTSLWFSTPTAFVRGETPKLASKPFKTSHEEQIKLVSSFDWLDTSGLKGVEEEFREVVKDSPFVDNARSDAICNAIRKRCEMLLKVIEERKKGRLVSADCFYDVEKDAAYSGKKDEN